MTKEELYSHPGWQWCTADGAELQTLLIGLKTTFREKLEWLDEAGGSPFGSGPVVCCLLMWLQRIHPDAAWLPFFGWALCSFHIRPSVANAIHTARHEFLRIASTWRARLPPSRNLNLGRGSAGASPSTPCAIN